MTHAHDRFNQSRMTNSRFSFAKKEDCTDSPFRNRSSLIIFLEKTQESETT